MEPSLKPSIIEAVDAKLVQNDVALRRMLDAPELPPTGSSRSSKKNSQTCVSTEVAAAG